MPDAKCYQDIGSIKFSPEKRRAAETTDCMVLSEGFD